jgi:hypothetical protein
MLQFAIGPLFQRMLRGPIMSRCLGDSKGCSSFEKHCPTSRQRAIVHGGRPVRAVLGHLQGICGHVWARLGSAEGPVVSPRRSLPDRVPAEVADQLTQSTPLPAPPGGERAG